MLDADHPTRCTDKEDGMSDHDGELAAGDLLPPTGVAGGHDIDLRTNEHKRAEKVLGKAVHPDALNRLFELWPKAKVEVKHYGLRHRKRGTRVTITFGAKSVHGFAECSLDDQYERKRGIQLAFQRALQKVRDINAAFGTELRTAEVERLMQTTPHDALIRKMA
jgi:hypothetical protein